MNLSILKSSLFKNTAIYTITDALNKALGFLTLPLISHYLIPEQLGIAANFDVLQSIVSLLAGQAIVNAMPYFYYGKSKEEQSKTVSSLLTLVVLTSVFLSIIIFACNVPLENYLHIGIWLQLLTVISVIAHLIVGLNLILFRLEDKPYSFAKLQMIQMILYLSILVLLVCVFKWGALGKIISIVIVYSIMAVIHFVMLTKRRYITKKINKDTMRALLKFGLPLLPHSLSFWLKSGFDKIIITTFCGLSANGLYSMALSFGAIYSMFQNAFNNSYIPYLQKRINNMTQENEISEKNKIVKLSYGISLGFTVLAFFLVVGCWFIVQFILDKQYKNSFQFIPWIMAGLTINSVYGIVIQFPYTIKKTFGMGIVTFSGSLVQLFLTYGLVSTIGIDGIKYSYVIGAFIIMIGVWIYSNKVYPMPWLSFLKK